MKASILSEPPFEQHWPWLTSRAHRSVVEVHFVAENDEGKVVGVARGGLEVVRVTYMDKFQRLKSLIIEVIATRASRFYVIYNYNSPG